MIFSVGCLTAGLPPAPNRLKHPTITAYPASPQNIGEAPGIPYYLPKPLLIISKNFHHINEHPYGLTTPAPIPGAFDDQSNYARLHARSQVSHSMSRNGGQVGAGDVLTGTGGGGGTSAQLDMATVAGASPLSPGGAAPRDGLAPITFFTYEIVFVPDLTQKYMLQISGGAGEMRAALNLINGWQFTGLGPFYMKDSSTAQNLMAKGVAINLGLQGSADIINSSANLVENATSEGGLFKGSPLEILEGVGEWLNILGKQEAIDLDVIEQGVIERYAEIYVYESYLDYEGKMQWRQIVGDFDESIQQVIGHRFERAYLGATTVTRDPQVMKSALEPLVNVIAQQNAQRSRSQSADEPPAKEIEQSTAGRTVGIERNEPQRMPLNNEPLNNTIGKDGDQTAGGVVNSVSDQPSSEGHVRQASLLEELLYSNGTHRENSAASHDE